MGINPVVMHDKDEGNERAEVFNEPILLAVGDETRRIMISNCIEDILGYAAPSGEKPYKAYKFISDNWNQEWESITVNWRQIVEDIFEDSFSLIAQESISQVEKQAAASVEIVE